MKFDEIINLATVKPYKLDLKKGFLEIGKRVIAEECKLSEEIDDIKLDDVIGTLESLYENYKHSVPSQISSRMKSYFKALPDGELSDRDYLMSESRHVAQAKLEFYLLLLKTKGQLDGLFGTGWFWQSKNDPDFVILKKWVA